LIQWPYQRIRIRILGSLKVLGLEDGFEGS